MPPRQTAGGQGPAAGPLHAAVELLLRRLAVLAGQLALAGPVPSYRDVAERAERVVHFHDGRLVESGAGSQL